MTISAVAAFPGLFEDGVEPGATVRLPASRCGACARVEFPRRSECPACGSPSDAIDLPSEGTLVGFSAVLYAPPGARVEAPYWIGVAEFDGAIRIMGLIDGVAGEGGDEELEIGMPVESVAVVVDNDLLTYAYRTR